MIIQIVSGVGVGPTLMAAYESALFNAGFNHNIISLSSIIPKGGKVITNPENIEIPGSYGDRLYAVLAHQEASTKGSGAWAGLGWVQNEDNGEGLFVEHHGASQEQVEKDIKESLNWFIKIRDRHYGPIQMVVRGLSCNGQPTSAVVAAIYQAEPWKAKFPGFSL